MKGNSLMMRIAYKGEGYSANEKNDDRLVRDQ